jgi:glyoxylase-like metal-dependent hydrolase (beta-lactamase superfamily II)
MRILPLFTIAAVIAFGQRPGPKLSGELSKVSEHVQEMWGFPAIVFVTGNTGVLAIDTGLGPSNGKIVADTAKRLGPGKKLFLTTTHFHPEHAAGDGGFPADTVIVRPRAQQRELDQSGAASLAQFKRSAEFGPYLEGVDKVRAADILFDDSVRIDLGGVTVLLVYYGPGHTEGDEIIFVEQDRVMVTGDIVQNKVVPAVAAAGGSFDNWVRLLDRLDLLKPLIVVPTHSRVGDGSLISQEKAFIVDMRTRALELKRQGVAVADAQTRMTEYFRTAYPAWVANTDWTNVAGVNGMVQRIYGEDK